jgi:hypothetical protein
MVSIFKSRIFIELKSAEKSILGFLYPACISCNSSLKILAGLRLKPVVSEAYWIPPVTILILQVSPGRGYKRYKQGIKNLECFFPLTPVNASTVFSVSTPRVYAIPVEFIQLWKRDASRSIELQFFGIT